MTQGQRGTPERAGASSGPVATSEAALEAIREARPWALAFAALLLTYAVLGGAVGVLWLIGMVDGLVAGPPPSRPFITASSVNLLFAPIALAGGVLAAGYFSAAGCACRRHGPDDLERASIALKRLWLWTAVAAIILIAFLACMFVAAVLTGEFPG
jgi:hypothetical protein